MKAIVEWVMANLCRVTGHSLWTCYNEAPGVIRRLWWWSLSD